MSAFTSLLADLVALLAADPPLVDGPVAEGRRVALSTQYAAGINVALASSRAQQFTLSSDVLRWQTRFVVELLQRANAGQGAGAAVDPVLVGVFQRLGSAPVPAGGFAWLLDPAVQWDIDEADTTVSVATLVVTIDHFANATTLAAVT